MTVATVGPLARSLSVLQCEWLRLTTTDGVQALASPGKRGMLDQLCRESMCSKAAEKRKRGDA